MAALQQARAASLGAQLQERRPAAAQLQAARPQARRIVTCAAAAHGANRRQALQLAGLLAAAPLFPAAALAAKGPKGFQQVKDAQDGYQFLYPFGWQEVAIDGQDVVYKDIIEPLESVSVQMVPTERTDISEYGPLNEVAYTLADKVLTGPNQEVKLLATSERVEEGRRYYDFEFTAGNKNYTRHALASVTVGNGKFYTLLTGANERRWNRMSDKIQTVVRSFQVFDRY